VGQRLHRLADIAPKNQHLHCHGDDRINNRDAEEHDHRPVRHQLEKGAGAGIDPEENIRVLHSDKADDEGRHTHRRHQADRQSVARKHRRQRSRPRVSGV
jgi:hypothetical protein